MDVASPIESRTAGRAAASGTLFTPFTARTSITLATLAKRDWRDRGTVPKAFGSFAAVDTVAGSTATSTGIGVDGDANGIRAERRARYRYPYHPSATGEGRAS